jgi:hypothetical protein
LNEKSGIDAIARSSSLRSAANSLVELMNTCGTWKDMRP